MEKDIETDLIHLLFDGVRDFLGKITKDIYILYTEGVVISDKENGNAGYRAVGCDKMVADSWIQDS